MRYSCPVCYRGAEDIVEPGTGGKFDVGLGDAAAAAATDVRGGGKMGDSCSSGTSAELITAPVDTAGDVADDGILSKSGDYSDNIQVDVAIQAVDSSKNPSEFYALSTTLLLMILSIALWLRMTLKQI
jgi:hypothetical protein